MLLAGAYIPPDRMGATWRLLETLVQGTAWGSTRMRLTESGLDDLDFALARGGVSAAVGLRHLLNTKTGLSLIPVQGLTVGWHRHEKALAMNEAYRSAIPQIKTDEQREMISALTIWLDGFVPWAQVASSLGRPVPGPDRLLGQLTLGCTCHVVLGPADGVWCPPGPWGRPCWPAARCCPEAARMPKPTPGDHPGGDRRHGLGFAEPRRND